MFICIGDMCVDGFMLLFVLEVGGWLVCWCYCGEDIFFWFEIVDWLNLVKVCGGNLLLFFFIGWYFVDGEVGCWCDVCG